MYGLSCNSWFLFLKKVFFNFLMSSADLTVQGDTTMVFNFKIPDFLSLKSNKRGMSLIEVSMATVLAAGVGFISMEAQDNARVQMKTINVYQSASALRASIYDLINNTAYLTRDIRLENDDAVGNCIPNTFGPGVEAFGTGACKKDGKARSITLISPSESSESGKFIGGLNGGNIADKNKPTYFTEEGDRCTNESSKKCVLAVKASFQASCAEVSCSKKNPPSILKVSVEMKDHRGKNQKASFAAKPTV